MQTSVMYLASPYSHPDEAIRHLRYLAVRETTAELLCSGTFVYSPIVHCHWMAVLHSLSPNIEFWQEYDFALIEALPVFGILELPGWSKSKGIEQETTFAVSLGRTPQMVSPVGTYFRALDRLAVANLDA